MDGIQLDYKVKNGMSSRFNQKLFGRISSRTYNGKKHSYYIPGVLDNVPHFRIFDSRIFISTATDVDFDPVMQYCDKFEISSVSKDEDDVFMKTGREKWRFHANERGLKIEW